MSTRAVYTFRESPPAAAIYIHSDGYLEGAATYFLSMLRVEDGSHWRQRGNLATRFLVANREHAELTTKATDHVDIEFHYVVKGEDPENAIVSAYAINDWELGNEREETLVWQGTIKKFTEEYAEHNWLPARYREVTKEPTRY